MLFYLPVLRFVFSYRKLVQQASRPPSTPLIT